MPSVPVYFATTTGNAATLAQRFCGMAQQAGHAPALQNLSRVTPGNLAGTALAVFIVSSFGRGDAPDDAQAFWQGLQREAVDLAGLQYLLFGLGDRDYEDFNGFARKLDERLLALGARPLLPRHEADFKFVPTYLAWEPLALAALVS